MKSASESGTNNRVGFSHMVEKLRLAGIVSGLTDPKTYKPILYIRTHIKGNVQGLPASVPIRLAIIDPFNIRAKRALMTRCRPIKGVNDTATPDANPAATA